VYWVFIALANICMIFNQINRTFDHFLTNLDDLEQGEGSKSGSWWFFVVGASFWGGLRWRFFRGFKSAFSARAS